MKRFIILVLLNICQVGYSQKIDFKNMIPANLDIGRGYNSLLGLENQSNMSICVDKSVGISSAGGNLQSGVPTARFHFYESVEDIVSQLDSSINASAKMGVDLFSLGIDFENKMNRKKESHKRYVFAVVEIEKIFQWLNLDRHALTREASAFFEKTSRENERNANFFHFCGDRFVSSVRLGIRVYAQVACSYSSKEEKDEISRTLKAAVGVKVNLGEGKIELSKKMSTYEKTTSNECNVYVEGIDNISPKIGFEAILEDISSKISSKSFNDGVVIDFETQPYSVILDQHLHDEVLGLRSFDFTRQNKFLQMRRDSLREFYEHLFYLNDLSAETDWDSRRAKTDIPDTLRQISKIKSEIKNCGINPFNPDSCQFDSPHKNMLKKLSTTDDSDDSLRSLHNFLKQRKGMR